MVPPDRGRLEGRLPAALARPRRSPGRGPSRSQAGGAAQSNSRRNQGRRHITERMQSAISQIPIRNGAASEMPLPPHCTSRASAEVCAAELLPEIQSIELDDAAHLMEPGTHALAD